MLTENILKKYGWYKEGNCYIHNDTALCLHNNHNNGDYFVAFAEVYEIGEIFTEEDLVNVMNGLGIR